MRLPHLLTLAALLLPLGATADEGEAMACTRTKVWEAYGEDWRLRMLDEVTLAAGERKTWKIGVYGERSYRVVTCGATGLDDLDLVVYGADGQVLAHDTGPGREPTITWTAATGGPVYVSVTATAIAAGAGPTVAAVAILHP